MVAGVGMWFDLLKKRGILGINRRNAGFMLLVNPRKYYPLVDDKLLSKQLAIQRGIMVPELYGVIRYHHEIRNVLTIAVSHDQFVVKPSRGSGGEGIVVIAGHGEGHFEKASGETISSDDLMHYISGILSGLYSLGGQDDKALIEYMVEVAPVFEKIAYRGVPDVRVIVYKGVPVISMVRLPTKESDGKANLHQGAIGVGVDLSEGITLLGVHHDRVVSRHPDTNHPIEGIRIPYWDEILEIAALSHEMTDLGYIGVDVVIDREKGPMVLEFNARPGLSIQIANQRGLFPRLMAVDAEKTEELTLEERIHLGQFIAQPERSRGKIERTSHSAFPP
jgi:alpha-L-glutamate ligase-like protein